MPVEGFRGDLKPSVMTSFSPLTRGHFHASSNLQMISSLVCCCERQVRSPLFIRTFSDGKWTVMNEIVYMFTSFALCMCKWLSFLYHLISVLIWEKKKKKNQSYGVTTLLSFDNLKRLPSVSYRSIICDINSGVIYVHI